MSNSFIPISEFVPGMNFHYNFNFNDSNSSEPRRGTINASNTGGLSYEIYINDEDIIGNNNASFIDTIKDNIQHIFVSSHNSDGMLFNASYNPSLSTSANITGFSAFLSASKSLSQPSVESIVQFSLTRNIAGSGGGGGGGSGSGVTNIVAGDGLTGGGNSSTVTLNVGAGTGITVNPDSISINASVTTLDDTQTLTNKTLNSAVLNGSISGSSIKDEDDMASNSASHVATQQSIKAYVDSQVSGSGSSAFTLNLGNDIILDNASYADYTPIYMDGTYSAGSIFSASNSTQDSASFTSILTNTTVDLCVMYGLSYFSDDSNTQVFCRLEKHTGSGSWTEINHSTLVGWSQSSSGPDINKSISRTLLLTLQNNECVRMVVKFSGIGSRNKLLLDSNASGSTYLSVFNIKSQNDSSASGITNIVGGAGLTVNNSIDTPTLSVNVDDSTIEIDTDILRIKDSGVSLSKISNLSNMKVIGNVSGGTATPTEISILDEDDLTSNSATSLATQQSIKAYVDSQVGGVVPGGSDTQIQFNNNGSFEGSSNLTFNDSTLTISGSLVVDGNVTFNGSTTEIKSENVVKTDPLLKLNSSLTSGSNTKDTGLILSRGSDDNIFIGWDESEDKIAFGLGNFTGEENGNLGAISPANVYGGNASFTSGSFTHISGDISNTTGYNASNLNGSITNAQLEYSSFTLGDVDISLGGNASSITGLTDISGTGNASFTSGSFTTLQTYDLIVDNEIDGTLTQTVKTDSNFSIGAALYVSGSLTNVNKFTVGLANANSSSTMPVIGLSAGNHKAITYGLLRNISDTVFDSTNASYEAGQTIYVSASNSGSLTNVKPSDNSDLIQNIGILKKYHSSNSAIFITGIGRSNDIPNASEVNYSDIQYIYGKNSNDRFIRASTDNISGESASFTNGSFINISGNISNTTGYNASNLTGTITNDQLAGSIENSKLANNSVSFGGVSLALGGTDATPAFDLTDATNYPASNFMSSGANNRILTATGTDAMQAEANLTFDGTTLNISGSLQLDSVTVSAIQTSSESFTDDDTSLMTSAAIQDKITSYGYSTTTGTVTSVTGTGSVNGLTLSGNVTNSGNLTLGGTLTINNNDWNGEDLSVSNGGTGASSLTQDAILRGNGTGAVTADSNLKFNGTRLDVTGDIHLPDDKYIYLGGSNDLRIYHESNGNHSHIEEIAGGDLVITASQLKLRAQQETQDYFVANTGGSVDIYYSGSRTFQTNASGITVTDINNATGTVTGNLAGNVTGTVSDISNHNTGDLAEGTNQYYTIARSRSAISVTDAGGDGSMSYDNSTGVITYTGPSTAEVRAHFSAGTGVTYSSGQISIGQAVGTSNDVTFNTVTSSLTGNVTGNVTGNADTATLATTVTVTDSSTDSDFPLIFHNGSNSLYEDQGSLTYNPNNGYLKLSDNKHIQFGSSSNSDLQIFHDGSNSHINEIGDGDLVITATHLKFRAYSDSDDYFVATTNSSVELYFNGSRTFQTNASGITVTDGNGSTGIVTGNLLGNVTGTVSDISNHNTGDLAEGTNQYYTIARSRSAITVTDAGGDGSLSYNSGTGVITYTGPSAAEVRTHFSGGKGVTITDGSIAIAQAVGTGDDVTFNTVTSSLTGNVTGNVTGNADTATLATTVTVTDSSTNSDFPVVFHDESNNLLDDTGSFTYNPSNSNLTIKSGTSNGKALLTMISDNAGNPGDGYQIESLNGSLTISSDHTTKGTYNCPIIEFSGSSTSASRTTKIYGELHVTEDITAFYTSDKRYKDNLKNISEPNEKIKKINGYEFDWNEKHNTYKGQHDVGVIAQEIEEVLPEVVTTRENGYKAVRYDKIISLLIESNKDLLRRVEELESKLS